MPTTELQRPPKRLLKLKVNGSPYEVAARPSAILLDVLRDDLGLVGTKRGCDMGTCGCCNVLIDGRAVMSCLVLAHDAANRSIWTIEGVCERSPGGIHPLQEAWSECGGSQCGFCTAGFVMTSLALLHAEPDPSSRRIREAIAGNVCRCTGYTKIVEAIETAARRMVETPACAAGAESLFE